MGGDLERPCGYGMQVGVNRVSGIGCVVGEPSALAMRRDWRGRSCFLLEGYLAELVVVDWHVAVGEGSGDVL